MAEVKTEEQFAEESYLQAVRIKLQKKGLSPESVEAEVSKIVASPELKVEFPAEAKENE